MSTLGSLEKQAKNSLAKQYSTLFSSIVNQRHAICIVIINGVTSKAKDKKKLNPNF
jgi:hypothetical protein